MEARIGAVNVRAANDPFERFERRELMKSKKINELRAGEFLQTKFLNSKIDYDGSQLRPLYAYMEHGILGNSIIAFKGACSIPFSHMVDGEDLREQSPIHGESMLHFIMEVFDQKLFAGVLLQRLVVGIMLEILNKKKVRVWRSGDDLYSFDNRKLSISIATQSVQSIHIHWALNINNKGTPVKTLSLEDLKVNPQEFGKEVLRRVAVEFNSIRAATMKVRSV